MEAICRAVGDLGDEVLVMPPVYHYIMSLAERAGRSRVEAKLRRLDGRWTLDLDAIDAAMGPRTRMLVLCNPHNPVGTVFSEEEL